jgi:glucosamine--fructose-6-phosphate aminotransferase (isomerizing)
MLKYITAAEKCMYNSTNYRGLIFVEKSILYKEILEQPMILQRLWELESDHIQSIADDVAGRFKYILIAARGSSDNAARYGQYLFGIDNRIQVALATPSVITIYKSTPSFKDAMVIAISQSGQSPDICCVVQQAKSQQVPTIAITNDKNSPLAQTADHVIQLHAGLERSIAATKTYSASLFALAIFSSKLNGKQEWRNSLFTIPALCQIAINSSIPQIEEILAFKDMQHCSVIGRGYNYSTAFEIALKIKELTGIIAEPYSSADFRHGPIATAHAGSPIIVIAVKGKMEKDILQLIEEVEHRNAPVIAITNLDSIRDRSTLSFNLPANIPEPLSPLVAILPGQLTGLRLAREKGLDPDHPFDLSKITMTR